MNKPTFGTYRGWSVEGGQWVYGGLGNGYIIVNFLSDNVFHMGRDIVRVYPESLAMFTGLYDQEDTPVYGSISLPDGIMSCGGDIMEYHYYGQAIQKSIMQYIDGQFVIAGSTYPMEFKHHDDSTFLIIGNAHEDLELLEDNK